MRCFAKFLAGFNASVGDLDVLLHLLINFLLNFKGHEKDSLKLMATYLPKDGGSSSAYQEGGGLYALGQFRSLFFLKCSLRIRCL